MICLIDDEIAGYGGLIGRIRSALHGDDGVGCRKLTVCGMPVLYVTIRLAPRMKAAAVRKRLGAAAGHMRREKAGRVVFSRDFPYRAAILREGFEEADGAVLTELFAGELAGLACPDGKTAALFAGSLSGRAVSALLKLCARFRNVLAVTESDAGALLGELGRRYGVSVVLNPSPGLLKSADVALVFGPPSKPAVLSGTCIAVPVGGASLENIVCRFALSGCVIGTKNGGEEALQGKFPPDGLLAAALEAGALSAGDIRIGSAVVSPLPETIRYESVRRSRPAEPYA